MLADLFKLVLGIFIGVFDFVGGALVWLLGVH